MNWTNLFFFLLIGLGLFLGGYFLERYLKRSLFFKRLSRNMGIYFYRIQFVVWGIYVLFAFRYLYRVGSTLTIVFLVVFSPILLNVLLGLFLRFEGVIQKGKSINVDDVEGVISRFYLTRLGVTDSRNKMHYYNYIYLFFSRWKRVKRVSSSDNQQSFSFLIEKNVIDEQALRRQIMKCTWINIIAPIEITKERNEMQITCQLLDNSKRYEVIKWLNNYIKQ